MNSILAYDHLSPVHCYMSFHQHIKLYNGTKNEETMLWREMVLGKNCSYASSDPNYTGVNWVGAVYSLKTLIYKKVFTVSTQFI